MPTHLIKFTNAGCVTKIKYIALLQLYIASFPGVRQAMLQCACSGQRYTAQIIANFSNRPAWVK